ncbi:MAG: FAD-dependent oxidoreductase [Acidobacteriaceae bacterium]|nr:FAD-dependent oxidoreductase [Acidobacteriaceae bacterium]MBV9501926.1 FAD-dependent oxidoreductase [Acidobacteriaceae bacterium]
MNFVSSQGKKFRTFDLLMEHEAVGLVQENGRIRGVQVKTANGNSEIHADLVVGCDGRHSAMREAAGLALDEIGVPIDVLWFRISRRPNEANAGLGNFNYGKAIILINRGDYFQAGMIIAKDSFDSVKSLGLPAFRENVRRIVPFLGDRVDELTDWAQIKLLSVQINRLRQWYRPGLLCIGDAAHAMSPAGGVGINLAIQDAVAAGNLLALPLRQKQVSEMLLRRVQKRREFPVRVTQMLQCGIHNLLQRVFRNHSAVRVPTVLRALMRLPGRQQLLGRMIGVGVRPEHIRTGLG